MLQDKQDVVIGKIMESLSEADRAAMNVYSIFLVSDEPDWNKFLEKVIFALDALRD